GAAVGAEEQAERALDREPHRPDGVSQLLGGTVILEPPDRALRLVERLEDARGIDHRSAFDAQEPGTRAGPDERLRLVTRDSDPAARVLPLRLPTHELCNGLAGQAARVAELADDVQPGARVHLAVRRTHAMQAGPRIRLAGAREELELRGLDRAVLDFAEQLVERVRLDLELLEPRLPGHELGVAGFDAAKRPLQLDEPPERDRVPVLGRRHVLEGLARPLPVPAVVEQMAEVDARLVVVRIDLERAPQVAAGAGIIPEAVQRVAERGDGLGAVRPERGGLQEDLAGLLEEPLAVQRPAHREGPGGPP